MRGIFSPDGPLMSALGKLADLVLCNIIFCACCIPVFTVGASLAALYECTQSIVEDTEDSFILRQFLKAFRKNFRQATALWMVCLISFGFLTAYYTVTGMLGSTMMRVYRVTFFVLLILFFFGFQYIFPLQARFQMPFRHLLKNAWLLSVAALPWTLLSMAVTVGSVYISLFMNPNAASVGIFLWAVALFAVVAYINSFFFRKAFQRVQKA